MYRPHHELILSYLKYISIISLVIAFGTVVVYITPYNERVEYSAQQRHAALMGAVERMAARCECFEPVVFESDVCMELGTAP